MKIVTIKMDLVIDEDITNKLYSDPKFFGDFGEENIMEVNDFE